MADVNKNYYGNSSIETIDTEREQVRKKPTIYFGTNDVKGCAHGVFELVTNSLDEIREGHGTYIKVIYDENGVITVIDDARGVPMAYHPIKKQYNWYLVYGKLYASGKFNSSNYGAAAGLNGVGAAITQFASVFMTVTSIRDEAVEWGKDKDGNSIPTKTERRKYTMKFKNGFPDGELMMEDTDEPTGTMVVYKPDRAVFLDTDIPVELFLDRFRRMAMLVDKSKIILDYKGTEFVLHYPDGCAGYIDAICSNRIIKDIIQLHGETFGSDEDGVDEPYNAKFDVALTFSRDTNFREVYHNGTYLEEDGVTYDGFKYALTKTLEEYARKNGMIAQNAKLSVGDVDEILVSIVSSECSGERSYFKGQYKTSIGNPLLKKLATNTVMEEFKKWSALHKEDMNKIIEAILINKEAREKANSVKKKVMNKIKSDINSISGKPAKFMKCESTDTSENEVYIVEGDSAKGSVVLARDGKFQAVMPVRGKILNCLKEPIERIMDSDVILDLCRVIGTGIEPKSRYIKELPAFDISKLNFGKIIICTDADIDGGHIVCLVLTMLYRLMPTLIKQGYVYMAESPLYTITCNGETDFAYNEEEKMKILSKLKQQGYADKNIDIQRSKGLGENDADMMWESTMNPVTRRLTKVEFPEGSEKDFGILLDALMGDDLESRRELIKAYFDMDVAID